MGFTDILIFVLLAIILLVIVSNFLMVGRDLAVNPIPQYIQSQDNQDYYPHSYYNGDEDSSDDEDDDDDKYGRQVNRNNNGYSRYSNGGSSGW